jgi:hypothetical protein
MCPPRTEPSSPAPSTRIAVRVRDCLARMDAFCGPRRESPRVGVGDRLPQWFPSFAIQYLLPREQVSMGPKSQDSGRLERTIYLGRRRALTDSPPQHRRRAPAGSQVVFEFVRTLIARRCALRTNGAVRRMMGEHLLSAAVTRAAVVGPIRETGSWTGPFRP